jgi:hypothetical protein
VTRKWPSLTGARSLTLNVTNGMLVVGMHKGRTSAPIAFGGTNGLWEGPDMKSIALILAVLLPMAAFAKTKKDHGPIGPAPGQDAAQCMVVQEFPTGKGPDGMQYEHPFTYVTNICQGTHVTFSVTSDSGQFFQGVYAYTTGWAPNLVDPTPWHITWTNSLEHITVHACTIPAWPRGPGYSCVVPNELQ